MHDHHWHSTVGPQYEVMQFAAARHTEVAMQLSVLWAVVYSTTQSILRHLPIDVSQVGVVGEMVARFQERVKWCPRLETSGSRVCDLVLGPMSDQIHLVAHLEEAIRQLQTMQDEHQALHNTAT
jgi:hypothetical protein